MKICKRKYSMEVEKHSANGLITQTWTFGDYIFWVVCDNYNYLIELEYKSMLKMVFKLD